MTKAQTAKPAPGSALRGLRWGAYWGGRLLQGIGLLLIWWVLLLFANITAMGALLVWVGIAAVVFYTGWACTAWARKDRASRE
jgi:hypothetical protein